MANYNILRSHAPTNTYMSLFPGCIWFEYKCMPLCLYRDIQLSLGSAIGLFYKLTQFSNSLVSHFNSVYKIKPVMASPHCIMAPPVTVHSSICLTIWYVNPRPGDLTALLRKPDIDSYELANLTAHTCSSNYALH